jgi:hypothetical protein
MKRETLRLLTLVVFVLLVGLSCNLSTVSPSSPTATDFGVLYTQAASTFIAQMTQSSFQNSATPQAIAATDTLVPSATSVAPTETLTPSPTITTLPSITPLPTFTPLPTSTATLPPGATPVQPPTSGGGGSGAPQLPCNAAQFLKDVTVPDGTEFQQGESFTKTWRLKNVGSCTWTKDYRAVFVDGDSMGAPTAGEPIPYTTKPGQFADVSVDLVAPGEVGKFKGSWMLSSPSGQHFGIGANYSKSFFVSIEVTEAGRGSVYNFATNYCAADWESSVAEQLPCPGAINDPEGFVLYFTDIDLENQHENEPTLWTNPPESDDSYIMGTYPTIDLKSGDRFLADVGCVDGYDKCDVLFQLKYVNESDKLKDLGEWHEVFDGDITRIELDLSTLADKNVQLVLVVDSNGNSKEDAAFWLEPHIQRK